MQLQINLPNTCYQALCRSWEYKEAYMVLDFLEHVKRHHALREFTVLLGRQENSWKCVHI